MKKEPTPSRSSPKGSKRGCLCWDKGTYSKKCCDGSLRAQGIGVTVILNYNENWEEITATRWNDINKGWENI